MDSLRPYGPNTLAGAFDRPGTYAVWVEHPGYQPSSFVAPPVAEGSCHVETQRLTVPLVPS